MTSMLRFALVLLATTAAFADTTPAQIAELVHESDDAKAADALRAALVAPKALVRATAARVIAVRGMAALLPEVREGVGKETDAAAAREEIRALGLLGTADDVRLARSVAAKWPAGMDNALAVAVARRGSASAMEMYNTTLRESRMTNRAEFFRVALWGQADAMALAGSRLIANDDERGWEGLLDALLQSNVAMHPPMLVASLGAPSEPIRNASVWYLIRGYAAAPESMPALVSESLAAPRAELSSDREDFGRELLRRMAGGEKRGDARWNRFLDSAEADQLLEKSDDALLFLTDAEYALRYARCEVQTRECALPKERRRGGPRTIPSEPVAPPAFDLPEVLPAGLAEAILDGSRCSASWSGVADASVDRAGRIRTLDLEKVFTPAACKRALDTLLRVSMATNTSARSGFAGPVLLVHPARAALCLDEDAPEAAPTSTYRTGGAVQAPKVIRRVDPHFPTRALESMGNYSHVLVIAEAIIAKSGCVRSIRLIKQSPYPELNAAALIALAEWKFRPGSLDGKPVDTIFNLSVNFKTP